MKKGFLYPDQIITLRDYPVYNEQILKIYFRVFQKNQGKILPACPVIHKSVGIPYVKGKDLKSKHYNKLLNNYLKKHPKAEFFLVDGGHKTAAATLAHRKIPVFLIEKDEDLIVAKGLAKKGDIFGWNAIEKSVKSLLYNLAKHHFGTKEFFTVEDKVKKMIKNKDIPDYIVSFYRRK